LSNANLKSSQKTKEIKALPDSSKHEGGDEDRMGQDRRQDQMNDSKPQNPGLKESVGA
jgi:hypothetical protein